MATLVSKIPGVRFVNCPVNRDSRGVLFKPMPASTVLENPTAAEAFGEVYIVTAYKGDGRGNHHHEKTTEFFCVLRGEARIRLEWNGVREEHLLKASEPITLVVPPGVRHVAIGDSDEAMMMMAYADRGYDPKDTDTFPANLMDESFLETKVSGGSVSQPVHSTPDL